MTGRDKLEVGRKEDAPHRKDNVRASEIHGPEPPTGPGRSPEIPLARVSGAEAPAEFKPRNHPAPVQPRKIVRYRPGPAIRR